jgi:hypothetical protein
VLKIANVTWKGRCATHPRYDPRSDGEGGIRGGCKRCYALLDIYEQHAALMRAVREFGPIGQRKFKNPESEPVGSQQSLFD